MGGGGAWTVLGVKREIGKKRGGRVFLKGWYPNAHYKLSLR